MQFIQSTQDLRHLESLELGIGAIQDPESGEVEYDNTSMLQRFSDLLTSDSFVVHHHALQHILVSSKGPAGSGVPNELKLWQVRKPDSGCARLEPMAADVAQSVFAANKLRFKQYSDYPIL